jgi:hypothetical protein
MGRTRAVAVRLAKEGRIDITQRGQVVAVDEAGAIKGPIRLRAVGEKGGGHGKGDDESRRAGGSGRKDK